MRPLSGFYLVRILAPPERFRLTESLAITSDDNRFDALDVIFAETTTGLHFDQFKIDLAGLSRR
jgi:hypothetical protein